MTMSNQPENENQQVETLTPEEVRQALLAELSSTQQEIAELSDEELVEISSGAGEDKWRHLKMSAIMGSVITATSAGVGALAAHHSGSNMGVGAGAGAAVGGSVVASGLACCFAGARNMFLPQPKENPSDIEMGTQR
jgi:hypothetical protein